MVYMPFFYQVLSQVPQCGLVNNWEGSCTLSKKEKKKPINEPENANKLKCEKSIKFSFNTVTLKKASFILSQFQNNVLNATESRRFRYFPSLWRNNLPGLKVPMGTLPLVVKRPWLTVHSQPSKTQVKINRQKVSKCFKFHYFC